MKIAVTGASGYVGGHIAAALRTRGHKVLSLSRATGFDLGQDTAPNLQGADALVHCAWDFRTRDMAQSRKINVRGAQRLLEAAAAAGIRKLVDISTMSAFAGCRSVYGRAKLEVEALFLRQGGCVIRPGLVWSDASGGMMGLLDRLARLPVAPVITGGGRLHPVHADDLSALVADMAATPENAIITVARPEHYSFGEILAARAGGRKPLLLPVPWQAAWLGVRLVETLAPGSRLRSDSIIGLVNADPAPRMDSRTAQFRQFQEKW